MVDKEYVQTRRVGDMTVTAVNDAVMPSEVKLNVPETVWREAIEADAEGKAVFDSHVFLVQTNRATILVDTGFDDPGSDWEDAAEDHLGPEQRARIGAIEEAGHLDLVDGECDVIPGVTMIPAPGESPGHSIVRVSSGGEELFLTGDLFHFGAEFEHLDWMVPWADEKLMSTSRQELLTAVGGTDALVAFTHETFPPWGRIVGDASSGCRWERAE